MYRKYPKLLITTSLKKKGGQVVEITYILTMNVLQRIDDDSASSCEELIAGD